MEALLLGLRDHLRTQLALDTSNCDVTIDGQPLAFSGEWFYAVHPGEFRHQPSGDDHPDELYGADVTITARSMRAPHDRWGTGILTPGATGLLGRAAALRAKVHLNYTLINLANAEIAGF